MTKTNSGDAMAERLDFAIALASHTGDQASLFQKEADIAAFAIDMKGQQDFVTAADKQAEDTIRAALAKAFPEDGFIGEETGGTLQPGFVWVVDPIDGTSNFMRRLPSWGVSIALIHDDSIMLGVIYDGASGKVFHARAGQGAFADAHPIRASSLADPSVALAITGHSRRTPFADYLWMLERLHDLGVDYRRFGAAALGLLRVADGSAELYFEAHLNSWDVLAGILIAREAGAIVDMPPLARLLHEGGPILAIAPNLETPLACLKQTRSASKAVTA